MADSKVPDDFVGAVVVLARDNELVLQHEGHQFCVVPVQSSNVQPELLLDYVHLGSHS